MRYQVRGGAAGRLCKCCGLTHAVRERVRQSSACGDVSQRTEPAKFRFKDPICMVQRGADANRCDRDDSRKGHEVIVVERDRWTQLALRPAANFPDITVKSV